MHNFSKDFFGSKLNITIFSSFVDSNIIHKCFFEVKNFENKYSRFKNNNFLYNLNKYKYAKIDNDLLSILKLSKKVSEFSDGYFDITVLPFLENLGYGIECRKLEEAHGYENIKIKKDSEIFLKNGVSIELGAVGKGYMVDKLYNILNSYYQSFIINFGGDIKVKGKHKIYLEDPCNFGKHIGYTELENSSIASSSGNRRKTKNGNHLINLKDNTKQDKLAVYTNHKLSVFSDILSTTIFVSPLKKAIEIIEKSNGLQAFIIMKDGSLYKSKGFNFKNNIEG